MTTATSGLAAELRELKLLETDGILTADEFETEAPTTTSDRQCAPLSVCDCGVEFESQPPTPFADRECQAYTECSEGFEEDPCMQCSVENRHYLTDPSTDSQR